MAKYSIAHVCGHTQSHQIYGTNNHGERDRKEAWLATTPCSDCYAAELQAKREADQLAATESNAAAGLPALVGSPKQIAWAETIRSTVMAWAPEMRDKALAQSDNLEEVGRAVLACVVRMMAEPSAKRWIDDRLMIEHNKGVDFFHAVARGCKDKPSAAAAINGFWA